MNRPQIKFTAIFIGSIFLLYFGLQILFGHRPTFITITQKSAYLFKDSVRYKLNGMPASWVAKHDNLTDFIFYENMKDKRPFYEVSDTTYNNYYIAVWEFKSLKNLSLNDAVINTNSNIEKSDFWMSEILDSESFCPITIKYLYRMDGMILNVNKESHIINEFSGTSYKGFYGLIDKISICNKNGDPQMYLNFKNKQTPTMLIIHSSNSGFHLIMINATRKIDSNIINILDLN